VTLRYVVIPGITTLDEDIRALADLVHSLPATVPVELLPYHSLGQQKWQALKMNYTLANVPDATPQDVTLVANLLKEKGVALLI
jgi:pyruvate formate lyase activating enzyme